VPIDPLAGPLSPATCTAAIRSYLWSQPLDAHEWFNGGGYPEGLAGEEISIYARIFAVADCYDALVSDRPYRKGVPKKQVVEMLREKSGIQFDPKVIAVFVRLCAEDETIRVTKDEDRLVGQTT
jgi:HD-GYP domain-containing protein (c-di-GMP phosphodiesterase class II)